MQQRGTMTGRGEERGCFAANNFLILLRLRVRVTGMHELHDLTGSDRVGRLRHVLQQGYVAEPDHQLKRPGVNEVANQHAGRIAEFSVGCRHAAPQGGKVHDVVVQECRCVNELHDRGEADMGVIDTPQRLGRQQDQQRSHALAARFDDVVANIFDQLYIRLQQLHDDIIDLRKFGRDAVFDGYIHTTPPESCASIGWRGGACHAAIVAAVLVRPRAIASDALCLAPRHVKAHFSHLR